MGVWFQSDKSLFSLLVIVIAWYVLFSNYMHSIHTVLSSKSCLDRRKWGKYEGSWTASCSVRVRPHATHVYGLMHVGGRPHAFYVYGLMHFSCTASCTFTYTALCKLCSSCIHIYIKDLFFIEINAILVFSIHSINSLRHYSCTI